jgi:hypothetical protein
MNFARLSEASMAAVSQFPIFRNLVDVCQRASGIPCALIVRAERILKSSGASLDRGHLSIIVIARSVATKQSILSFCGTMDCFASLAMTVDGCAA